MEIEIVDEKETRVKRKKKTSNGKAGRPPYDPFRKQIESQGGVANTYVKNIPARDWEKFRRVLSKRGQTSRWAMVRFVQELPQRPEWMKELLAS